MRSTGMRAASSAHWGPKCSVSGRGVLEEPRCPAWRPTGQHDIARRPSCGTGEALQWDVLKRWPQSLGTVVFGGMLASTLLAIPFVSVFYIVMEGFSERRRARKASAAAHSEVAVPKTAD